MTHSCASLGNGMRGSGKQYFLSCITRIRVIAATAMKRRPTGFEATTMAARGSRTNLSRLLALTQPHAHFPSCTAAACPARAPHRPHHPKYRARVEVGSTFQFLKEEVFLLWVRVTATQLVTVKLKTLNFFLHFRSNVAVCHSVKALPWGKVHQG